jgi:protein SCO1
MLKTATLAAAALAFGTTTIAVTRRVHESRSARHDALGVVVSAPEQGRVRISHGDIPGYMPGMTFVLGQRESGRLAPGDRISFVLRTAADHSWIENVQVTGRTAGDSGSALPSAPVRLRKGDALPPLSLIDQDGLPLTATDFTGHLTVVTFVLTRCPVPDYCPLLSRRFSQIQAALTGDMTHGRDVRLLSVTIDPDFDTPPVLKAYARAIGADPSRWRFAGGNSVEVLRVARAFSVYTERNRALLNHTLATALIDRTGHVVEIWRGNEWKPAEILDRLR